MTNHGKNERILALGLIAILLLTAMSFAPTVQAQEQAQETQTPTNVVGEDCGDAYTVRSSDSLGVIALRCGVTVAALLGANPDITDRSLIITGQQINIPQGDGGIPVTGGGIWAGLEPDMAPPRFGGLPAPTQQATAVGGEPQQATQQPTEGATQQETQQATQDVTPGVPVTGGTYTVQEGDTFQSIAAQLGITVSELLQANPDLIQPGDVLNLPEGVQAPTQGVPVTGGTPTATRQATQPATQEATQGVPVTGGTPTATQEAMQEVTPEATQGVPVTGGTPTATQQATQAATQQATPGATQGVPVTGGTYTVEEGDTIQSIAAQLGIRINQLLEANPDLIQPGDVLNLPAGVRAPTPGATQGVPVTGGTPTATRQAMQEATQQPTQGATQQATPGATQGVPVTGGTYTVQEGDTLQSIATQLGITVDELLQANPDLVQPGDVLNLPEGVQAPTQGVPVTGGTPTATAGTGGGTQPQGTATP